MIRYTCTLLLCLVLFTARAQDIATLPINLQRLEAYVNKPASQVSDSLIKEGWKLNAELSGSMDGDDYRTFSYGNLETDQKKALAWLRIHFAGTLPVNRVYYQAPDEETYSRLVVAIKATQSAASLPQTIEGQTLTVYTGDNYVYQTIVSASTYTVVVISKEFFTANTSP